MTANSSVNSTTDFRRQYVGIHVFYFVLFRKTSFQRQRTRVLHVFTKGVCVCACGICALRPHRQRAVPSIRFYIKCEYVSLVRDPPHSDIICLLPCGANIEEFRVVELSAFRSLGPASRFPFRVGCSNISDCSDLTNILYGQVTDVYA